MLQKEAVSKKRFLRLEESIKCTPTSATQGLPTLREVEICQFSLPHYVQANRRCATTKTSDSASCEERARLQTAHRLAACLHFLISVSVSSCPRFENASSLCRPHCHPYLRLHPHSTISKPYLIPTRSVLNRRPIASNVLSIQPHTPQRIKVSSPSPPHPPPSVLTPPKPPPRPRLLRHPLLRRATKILVLRHQHPQKICRLRNPIRQTRRRRQHQAALQTRRLDPALPIWKGTFVVASDDRSYVGGRGYDGWGLGELVYEVGVCGV